MADVLLTPPQADEVEISLFGPGYGECVLVHLGNGHWLVNDSCTSPSSAGRMPVALSYLRSIGIAPSEHIRLLVASHWHDDHVSGLSDFAAECPDAAFVCSMALRSNEFLQLIKLAEASRTSLGSGVSELKKIIDFRRNNATGALVKFAVADLPLWKDSESGATVYALSPSDESIAASLQDISELVDEIAQYRTKVPPLKPNAASIVLWVDLGHTRVLLGGDLENHSNSLRGWRGIVSSTTRPAGKAEVYKVAHHGSITAHCDDIWQKLLQGENISVIAPWQLGRAALPKDDDLRRISGLSHETYVTTTASSALPRQRSKLVMQTMAQATRSWQVRDASPGHIQLRRRADRPWRVGLSPNAFQVTASGTR
ncbi:ComEC/Rec2 family competence protein [Micromonospora chersina]|uniref:ComEC/Rec2 family competence protein n=1 Tax=Micromonospora chersina TaxID=47854 RepID=UPI003C8A26CB